MTFQKEFELIRKLICLILIFGFSCKTSVISKLKFSLLLLRRYLQQFLVCALRKKKKSKFLIFKIPETLVFLRIFFGFFLDFDSRIHLIFVFLETLSILRSRCKNQFC